MTFTEPTMLETIFALLCIIVVTLIGFLANGLSLQITITNSQFQNAYGTLRTAVLLCNTQTISVMLIWGAIVLITNSRKLSSSEYFVALIPGCLANVSFYGSILMNLLIALNRYCAFAFPIKYHGFWTVKKARTVGIIVYFLGFLPCFPSIFGKHLVSCSSEVNYLCNVLPKSMRQNKPCTLIFNAELDFRWSYSDTNCGYINSMFDTTLTSSMLIIAGCIDFITLLKIRNYNKVTTLSSKKMNKSMANSTNHKQEMVFFKQASTDTLELLDEVLCNLKFVHFQSCIGGFTMIVSSLVFNIGPHFLTNKWALFAVTTIGWEMAHVSDGDNGAKNASLVQFSPKMISSALSEAIGSQMLTNAQRNGVIHDIL
uniref:G_PROTEIN_RECEP_F1_2 domain-containing protein n=1 Tax=Elaeophora elaphi TaxID=1147741 RepID=A0A0R3RML3_9BILA